MHTLDPVEERNPGNQLPAGPSRPGDRVPLSVGRFRAERQYLADHVFLSVPGGGAPPSELVDRKTWEGIMDLPTDVLLRTTDYLGHMVNDLDQQGGAWIHATPTQPSDSAFMFEPAMDRKRRVPSGSVHRDARLVSASDRWARKRAGGDGVRGGASSAQGLDPIRALESRDIRAEVR